MDPITLLRTQIEGTHQIVESTMDGVSEEDCHVLPGGNAHPIGATYFHLLMGEDFIINMLIRGSQPLSMSSWAGKSGVSEPPPPPGGDLFGWANRVKVDLPQVRQFAQAVYANTLEWLATVKPEDLSREMDIPGFGKFPMGYYLTIAGIIHPSNHIGEISALKGIQGGKGYPF